MNLLAWASAAALGAALIAGAAACASHAGGSCHSSSDCASGLFCSGPNDGPSCGIPPHMGCALPTDCTGGEQCHVIEDPCSRTGLGSECGPPCTSASCNAGLRCNAQGACEPIPCDQGFACPTHEHCDATVAHATGPVYTRTQGCVRTTCKADADCPPATLCVNAVCQDGAGVCREAVAVP